MTVAANLIGETFGRLTVVSRETSTSAGKARWRCQCECGGETIVGTHTLRSGASRSCGCLQTQIIRDLRTKHGGSAGGERTKEYRAWLQVRRRCLSPNSAAFKNYGAKGISIDPEWAANFDAFLAHIGQAPSDKHTVDRIDNARGYEPGNVRWATSSAQNRNKRKNIYVRLNGVQMLLVEACEQTGTDYYTAYSRLRRGLPPFSVR